MRENKVISPTYDTTATRKAAGRLTWLSGLADEVEQGLAQEPTRDIECSGVRRLL